MPRTLLYILLLAISSVVYILPRSFRNVPAGPGTAGTADLTLPMPIMYAAAALTDRAHGLIGFIVPLSVQLHSPLSH